MMKIREDEMKVFHFPAITQSFRTKQNERSHFFELHRAMTDNKAVFGASSQTMEITSQEYIKHILSLAEQGNTAEVSNQITYIAQRQQPECLGKVIEGISKAKHLQQKLSLAKAIALLWKEYKIDPDLRLQVQLHLAHNLFTQSENEPAVLESVEQSVLSIPTTKGLLQRLSVLIDKTRPKKSNTSLIHEFYQEMRTHHQNRFNRMVKDVLEGKEQDDRSMLLDILGELHPQEAKDVQSFISNPAAWPEQERQMFRYQEDAGQLRLIDRGAFKTTFKHAVDLVDKAEMDKFSKLLNAQKQSKLRLLAKQLIGESNIRYTAALITILPALDVIPPDGKQQASTLETVLSLLGSQCFSSLSSQKVILPELYERVLTLKPATEIDTILYNLAHQEDVPPLFNEFFRNMLVIRRS